MKILESCKHENFNANVSVNRIVNDSGIVIDFLADLKIHCLDCDLPFSFKGLPKGFSGNQASSDLFALEARLPIEPADDTLKMKSRLPGFTIKQVT